MYRLNSAQQTKNEEFVLKSVLLIDYRNIVYRIRQYMQHRVLMVNSDCFYTSTDFLNSVTFYNQCGKIKRTKDSRSRMRCTAGLRFGFFFICFGFSTHSRVLCGDVTIISEGLQIFTFARHFRPSSSVGYLTCHTHCGTGHPFHPRTRDTDTYC